MKLYLSFMIIFLLKLIPKSLFFQNLVQLSLSLSKLLSHHLCSFFILTIFATYFNMTYPKGHPPKLSGSLFLIGLLSMSLNLDLISHDYK